MVVDMLDWVRGVSLCLLRWYCAAEQTTWEPGAVQIWTQAARDTVRTSNQVLIASKQSCSVAEHSIRHGSRRLQVSMVRVAFFSIYLSSL